MDSLELSIARLIRERMRDLGITRGGLVRRMGYCNIAKGCRRIDQVCHGQVEMAGKLRDALVRGLEVDIEVVDKAIEGTRTEMIAAEDKAYRESFKPHAVILTERKIPSQITIYAMTGGSRHRHDSDEGRIIARDDRDTGARGPSGSGSLFRASNRVRNKLHSRFRLKVQQEGQIDRKARPGVSRGAIKRRCRGQGSRREYVDVAPWACDFRFFTRGLKSFALSNRVCRGSTAVGKVVEFDFY